MLNENLKRIRKSKGLTQEELAVKCSVVRQTVSKWEKGLSVPDADLLISVADALGTSVSTLLGETVPEQPADFPETIAEKLEVINLQFARQKEARRKTCRLLFFLLFVLTVLIGAFFAAAESPYLQWNFSDPETAVLGTAFHAFEWLFVRTAPFLLIGSVAGMILTRKKG